MTEYKVTVQSGYKRTYYVANKNVAFRRFSLWFVT